MTDGAGPAGQETIRPAGRRQHAFHAQAIAVAARTAAADALIATRRADPETVAAAAPRLVRRSRKPGRRSRNRRLAALAGSLGVLVAARQLPLGVVPATPCAARWRWPWPCRRRPQRASSTGSGWCSARCRCCARTRRPPGPRRCGRWPAPRSGSRRRGAAARHRHRPGRAVGRAAGRRPRRRRTRRGPRRSVSARPRSRSPSWCCSTCWPGRLAGRPAAHRGRRDRLRGQPGGRGPVLAARRGARRRRRPGRRLPHRRRVPDPGRGLGARPAARRAATRRSPP